MPPNCIFLFKLCVSSSFLILLFNEEVAIFFILLLLKDNQGITWANQNQRKILKPIESWELNDADSKRGKIGQKVRGDLDCLLLAEIIWREISRLCNGKWKLIAHID